jgi:DnaJ-class molecular chaperone
MICQYCHGHGYTEREAKDGTIGEIRCPYCGGYGEVQDGNREHKETNRD